MVIVVAPAVVEGAAAMVEAAAAEVVVVVVLTITELELEPCLRELPRDRSLKNRDIAASFNKEKSKRIDEKVRIVGKIVGSEFTFVSVLASIRIKLRWVDELREKFFSWLSRKIHG